MSYANATVTPAQRAKAATTVIGIHALIGAGLIAGLAVTTFEPVEEPPSPKATIVVEPPPPADPQVVEDPVPQPRDIIYVPPSPFPLTPNDPIPTAPTPAPPGPPITNPGEQAGPRPTETPRATPSPTPSPSPTIAAVAARPTNGPAGWITTDDYPDRDLRRGNEGTGSYRLTIGSNGRVTGCEMARTTGHSGLDRQTCRVIQRVARFTPATDTTGARVAGSYTGEVTWQIPE